MTTEGGQGADAASGSRWRLIAAAAIVAVLLACGGFLLGRFTSPAAVATPTTDSAAAGFLRDMQVHHAQAVDMSYILRDQLSPDDASYDPVRLIAFDIANAQGNQAGQMKTASGVEAERQYLTLMIAHHRGGVEMAEAILTRTDVPQVLTMAANMKKAQTSEITVMQDMLDALPAG